MNLITRDSQRSLQRSVLIILLGLFCLVVVAQAQGETPPATTSGAATSTNAASSSVAPTATGSGAPGTATGTASGGPSGGPSGTATAAPPTPSVPANATGSQLTMIEPKPNQKNPPLFAIGTNINFTWAFDNNLVVPPANLTIEAIPDSTPTRFITIGQGIQGTAHTYIWTKEAQDDPTNPLRTDLYSVRIYDGALGRDGHPRPGYLVQYAGLKFGLYIPNQGGQGPNACATCEFSSTKGSAMKAMVPIISAVGIAVMTTLTVML